MLRQARVYPVAWRACRRSSASARFKRTSAGRGGSRASLCALASASDGGPSAGRATSGAGPSGRAISTASVSDGALVGRSCEIGRLRARDSGRAAGRLGAVGTGRLHSTSPCRATHRRETRQSVLWTRVYTYAYSEYTPLGMHIRTQANGPARVLDVHVRAALARVANAAAELAREPVADRAAALDVDHDAPTVDLLAVCVLVRGFEVALALVLDKRVAAGLAIGVFDQPHALHGSVLLKLVAQLLLGRLVANATDKQRLVRVLGLALVRRVRVPCVRTRVLVRETPECVYGRLIKTKSDMDVHFSRAASILASSSAMRSARTRSRRSFGVSLTTRGGGVSVSNCSPRKSVQEVA